jgi:hypothetical protein
MIDKKEVPISVQAQYLTAMKYSGKPRIEVLVKDGVNFPDTDEKQNDDETNKRIDAWIHGSHLTDNKLLNDTLNNTTVDIGQQKDWSISDYKEERLTTIDGKEYLNQTAKLYYDSKNSADTDITLNISKTKDGKDYTIESLAPEQKNVVLAVMDTIVKFLRNDKNYVPFRGTIMGCGGTGKSYIINTILTMIANMTKSNAPVLIGAPSGSAAFNVQGSTLHHLLGIGVTRPEDNITQKVQEKLQSQLKNVLCLFIDERSMLSSKVLSAAERNIRKTVYNGQNSQEIWGGVPAVVLFGDDYQLWPVIEEGAIQGYSKMTTTSPLTPTNKQTAAQLLCQWGTYLFTHVMTESVFFLHQNYRVKSEEFQELLARLRVGESTTEDAQRITDLHLAYYEHDKTFMTNLTNDPKTMWLYAKNVEKDKKNMDMLIQTSKMNKVPVARLNCHYETNRAPTSDHQQPAVYESHFDKRMYDKSTDICVGARVAISNVNILPEVGLYNRAIGTVVEIVYNNRPEGPNDKEHYHLPDYVVVDFPNLKLPDGIPPWDKNHKTVSLTFSSLLSLTPHGNFSNCEKYPQRLKHVPIAMISKFCKRKQSCCKVTYCPLVPAWATSIQKFQGLEAGFDKYDQFKHVIVDPGDLMTELLNPGMLYIATSRAKTIGTVTPNELHPKDSAIFWTGSGMCLSRVLNITQKRGLDGNMTNCLKVDKRQKWVDHLFEQSCITSLNKYNAKKLKKIERRLAKKIKRTKKVDLQTAIATIITNPNETWKNLKREKYMVPKSYFQNNY